MKEAKAKLPQNPFSMINIVIPSRIPDGVWREIKNFTTIARHFGIYVWVTEANLNGKFMGGSTKCPFCGKKFSDIWARKAYERLQQHINDKHYEFISKTIQTSTQASWGDRSWNEAFYEKR
jgi:hypothetical protein